MEPIIISRIWTQGANVEVEALRGTAFTEEDGAHQFRVAGEDPERNPIALTGTILGKLIRADNLTVDISGSIDSATGEAVLTLVADCYHVPGRFSLVIYRSDGTSSQAIYACVGRIFRATSGQELDSGTTVPSLAELEAAYQGALSVLNHSVLYDDAQALTVDEKARARANIGLTWADDGQGNITVS